MSALEKHIAALIRASGPLTLSEFMALCLQHPEHGYYTTRDPLGASGDFTTAPEISQMFGELIGLCLAQAWLDAGSPKAFTLAELGPGDIFGEMSFFRSAPHSASIKTMTDVEVLMLLKA